MIFLALQAFPAVLTLVPIFQILATISRLRDQPAESERPHPGLYSGALVSRSGT